MSLKLMYITNQPEVACIAQAAGVDYVFIDMEYIGKDTRQGGMDTVQCHHTIADICRVRKVLDKSGLLVRINPVHVASSDYSSTKEEVNAAIDAGADILMLPMFRTMQEIETFLNSVNGRAKTMLLAETPEACSLLPEVACMDEVYSVHIGLNDLHLALNKKFMFELLSDGFVERVTQPLRNAGKPFGFGGIARLGFGILPAEKVIAEHYRLGSSQAILSRSFCNVDKMESIDTIEKLFHLEVAKIRKVEQLYASYSMNEFEINRCEVIRLVQQVVGNK